MSLLQGLMFYIKAVNKGKFQEVQKLSEEAQNLEDENLDWVEIKQEWNFTNQDLYFPHIWKQANSMYGPPETNSHVKRINKWIRG